jgi:hypothetical protein
MRHWCYLNGTMTYGNQLPMAPMVTTIGAVGDGVYQWRHLLSPMVTCLANSVDAIISARRDRSLIHNLNINYY